MDGVVVGEWTVIRVVGGVWGGGKEGIVGAAGLQSVDERERVFAFVEVFTEAFGFGILCKETEVSKLLLLLLLMYAGIRSRCRS